jgi:hypothetical protein
MSIGLQRNQKFNSPSGSVVTSWPANPLELGIEPKVIYNQGEENRVGVMFEYTTGDTCFFVS